MRGSAPVRSIGQSQCCYRPRAIEYEYRTLTRPEYDYEGTNVCFAECR